MRLFIALWPGAGERQRLARLAPRSGRAVPAADLHLTLAFLGEVPASRLAQLRRLLGAWAERALPVQLEALQAWPGALVATGTARGALRQRQGLLVARLRAAGLALDRRAFRPHVTLARWRPPRAAPAWPAGPIRLAGQVVVLAASGLAGHAGGPRYRVLAAWRAGR